MAGRQRVRERRGVSESEQRESCRVREMKSQKTNQSERIYCRHLRTRNEWEGKQSALWLGAKG